MSSTILIGDCRLRMKELADNSVDSVVCDPPYHLTSIVKRFGSLTAAPAKVGKTGAYARHSTGFMGQKWDGGDIAQDPAMWAEVLRVLKPGGHLVAFSSTRTYHRMACAIEDAGFEVRDCLFYHYGSGFPKSHNVGKALDAKKERCSCNEDLRSVRSDLGSRQSLSGQQQDLRESLHGEANLAPGQGKAIPVQDSGDCELLGLPEAVRAAPMPPQAGEAADVQQPMQRESAGAQLGPLLGQHEGPEAGAAIRSEQPGLEGRSDVQEGARELQGRQVCEGAEVVPSDGPDERLHHGAPPSDGADVRVSADADGGGQPQGSQPGEQSPEQLRVVADERRPQAWGGWPVCGRCRKPIVAEGLGTALKPATEPICLARKPLDGTVAGNVLAHGTGALNIDGCRIGAEGGTKAGERARKENGNVARWEEGNKGARNSIEAIDAGRWPANLCHDGSDEVLAGFPAEAGGGFGVRGSDVGNTMYGGGKGLARPATGQTVGFGDSGSAARFFYCAKATSEERGSFCNICQTAAMPGDECACIDPETGKPDRQAHPTQKPISLMRWLARLVTPPGGTIFDPFMGSGSTLIAADAEQFHAIGCELSPEYAAIAERRIRDAAGMFADVRVAA